MIKEHCLYKIIEETSSYIASFKDYILRKNTEGQISDFEFNLICEPRKTVKKPIKYTIEGTRISNGEKLYFTRQNNSSSRSAANQNIAIADFDSYILNQPDCVIYKPQENGIENESSVVFHSRVSLKAFLEGEIEKVNNAGGNEPIYTALADLIESDDVYAFVFKDTYYPEKKLGELFQNDYLVHGYFKKTLSSIVKYLGTKEISRIDDLLNKALRIEFNDKRYKCGTKNSDDALWDSIWFED